MSACDSCQEKLKKDNPCCGYQLNDGCYFWGTPISESLDQAIRGGEYPSYVMEGYSVPRTPDQCFAYKSIKEAQNV